VQHRQETYKSSSVTSECHCSPHHRFRTPCTYQLSCNRSTDCQFVNECNSNWQHCFSGVSVSLLAVNYGALDQINCIVPLSSRNCTSLHVRRVLLHRINWGYAPWEQPIPGHVYCIAHTPADTFCSCQTVLVHKTDKPDSAFSHCKLHWHFSLSDGITALSDLSLGVLYIITLTHLLTDKYSTNRKLWNNWTKSWLQRMYQLDKQHCRKSIQCFPLLQVKNLLFNSSW
jgi:hypothetical protein